MNKLLFFLLILILAAEMSMSAPVTDYIVSKGGFGPYAMSNTKPVNCKAYLGSQELDTGSYFVNSDSGVIGFTKYMDKGVVVRVDYDKASDSKTNPGVTEFVKTDDGSVGKIKLVTYYGSDKAIAGMGASKSFSIAGGELSTDFAMGISDKTESINMEQLAGKLGYQKNFGKLKLGATYTAAGDDIGGVTGYTKNTDITDILLVYSENNINISSGYTGYNTVTDKQIYTNKITLNPKSGTKISFSSNIEDGSSDKTSNIYGFEQAFKKCALTYNRADTDTSGTGSSVNTLVLSGTGFKMLAVKSDQKIASQLVSEENSITVSGNPDKTVTVSAGIKEIINTTSSKTTEIKSASFIWKPSDVLLFDTKGNYITGDTDLLITESNIKYTTTLGKKLGLTSSVKALTSGGDFGYEGNAGLTYKPSNNMAFTAIYKDNLTIDDNYIRSMRFGADTKYSNISMAALYVGRYLRTGEQPDTKIVNISYKPLKTLTITTSYADTPENTDGTLKTETQSSASLEWGIGTVYVTSGIGRIRNNLNPEDLKDTAKFGLKTVLWSGSAITAGIDFSGALTDKFIGSRVYSLGYTLTLSADTFFKLGGTYAEINTTTTPNEFKKDNVTAEASIGIKF